jgi:hypothetical protein
MDGVVEAFIFLGIGLLSLLDGIFCRAFVKFEFDLYRAFGVDPQRLVSNMDTYVGTRRTLSIIAGVVFILWAMSIPGSRARQREEDAAWQRNLDEMKQGPKRIPFGRE